MTQLRLNKAHFPVTVLGPGRRIGLWFQGCSIHCAGCVSKDTWDREGGAQVKVAEIVDWCKAVVAGGGFDGVTISGGEPFEQPEALLSLLRTLVAWREADRCEFDILCYSGMPYRRLVRHYSPQLELIDILCPEPYVDSLPRPSLWRGSPNQPLLGMTDRGRRIVSTLGDAAPGKNFQLDVRDGRVWFIGIPSRGDMQRVRELAASRGLELGGVSWMS